MINNFFKKNNGFTLVEATIIFSIVILVAGASLEIFKNTLQANDSFFSSLNSQSEVRNAFKAMSANIRSASLSSLGAYPIDSAATSSFVYYSDIDGDNLKERVRYFLENNSLKEGILKPSGSPLSYSPANEKIHPLIKNVVNSSTPIFEYYDSDYDGQSSPLSYPLSITNIRLIKITALINKNTKSTSAPLMEFITQVSIRNLKDNL